MKFKALLILTLLAGCSSPTPSGTPSASPGASASPNNAQISAQFVTALREACQKSDPGPNLDKAKLCECTAREYTTRLAVDITLATDPESAKSKQAQEDVGTKCGLEAIKK